MTKKHDNTPNMPGYRNRNKGNGRLRDKRDDTSVGSVEARYRVDFGVRSDMKLGTLMERENASSLKDLLKKHRKNKS